MGRSSRAKTSHSYVHHVFDFDFDFNMIQKAPIGIVCQKSKQRREVKGLILFSLAGTTRLAHVVRYWRACVRLHKATVAAKTTHSAAENASRKQTELLWEAWRDRRLADILFSS